MFRQSMDKKGNAVTGLPKNKKDKSNMKKPIFPAYVPSHLEFCNKKDDTKKPMDEIYETNQLYVTNLPTNTNMHDMSKLFPECVGIALDVNEKSESHAAYLEFEDTQTAQRVCQNSRGAVLRGNTLIIAPKVKYN